MVHETLRISFSVKKESPNMGTKTIYGNLILPHVLHPREKRIPKHGDENYVSRKTCLTIFHDGEKRIPKHGDENTCLIFYHDNLPFW